MNSCTGNCMQMWLPFLAVWLMSSDSSIFLFHVIFPSPSCLVFFWGPLLFPFPFIFHFLFPIFSTSLLISTFIFHPFPHISFFLLSTLLSILSNRVLTHLSYWVFSSIHLGRLSPICILSAFSLPCYPLSPPSPSQPLPVCEYEQHSEEGA